MFETVEAANKLGKILTEIMNYSKQLEAPGVLHHVMGRGIERKEIFFR
jgi:hypothetical protein